MWGHLDFSEVCVGFFVVGFCFWNNSGFCCRVFGPGFVLRVFRGFGAGFVVWVYLFALRSFVSGFLVGFSGRVLLFGVIRIFGDGFLNRVLFLW